MSAKRICERVFKQPSFPQLDYYKYQSKYPSLQAEEDVNLTRLVGSERYQRVSHKPIDYNCTSVMDYAPRIRGTDSSVLQIFGTMHQAETVVFK